MATTRARNFIIKENNLDPSVENVDIPTSFDGTWCSRGWTARRGVVTAITEKIAQVIDVSYICKLVFNVTWSTKAEIMDYGP